MINELNDDKLLQIQKAISDLEYTVLSLKNDEWLSRSYDSSLDSMSSVIKNLPIILTQLDSELNEFKKIKSIKGSANDVTLSCASDEDLLQELLRRKGIK